MYKYDGTNIVNNIRFSKNIDIKTSLTIVVSNLDNEIKQLIVPQF